MSTRNRKHSLLVYFSILIVGLLAVSSALASATVVWTQISPDGASPSPRFGTGSAYDVNTDRLIMFAGFTLYPANFNDNDVWVLKNAMGRDGQPEWVNLISSYQPGSPTPRHWYGATYDPNNNRLIIFGGCGGGCYPTLNDTWVLTNANGTESTAPQWIKLLPSGIIPAGRSSPRISYDPVNNRVILYSGQNGSGYGGAVYNDVWILTNANGLGGTPVWTKIVSSMPIIGQYWAGTAYDQASNRLIIFGGVNQYGQITNGVWVLKNANGLGGAPELVNLIPDGAPGSPPKQANCVTVYDPVRNQLLIFSTDGTTWLLANANGLGGAPVWEQLASPGSTPVGRSDPANGYDPAVQQLVMWGGSSAVTLFLTDGWWLNLNQPPIAEAGGPYSADWGVSFILDGSGSSDPEDSITSYEWDLDNDGEYDDATGVTATTSFTVLGEQLIGLRVTDDAGLSDTDTATVTITDSTPPIITWVGGINDGDEFIFGNVPPEPTCTAMDDLSGVDGICTVSGYAATVGSYTLIATARDYAGNQATEVRSYTVLGWTLTGFYPPVDMDGVFNVAKPGSTIPLKFEIFAGETELTETTAIKSVTSALVICDTEVSLGYEVDLLATGGTSLRYDLDEGQFIFNWTTPDTPRECYRVTLTTLDGYSLVAYFRLK